MLILESFLNWTVHDFLPLIMISSAQTLVMIGVSPKAPLICEEEHISEEFRYCQRASSLHWLIFNDVFNESKICSRFIMGLCYKIWRLKVVCDGQLCYTYSVIYLVKTIKIVLCHSSQIFDANLIFVNDLITWTV